MSMIFRELHLSSKERDSRCLVESLRKFTDGSSVYEAAPEEVARYRESIGADAYILLTGSGGLAAAIYFASSDGETLYVPNIIPLTRSEMSVTEYNDFLVGLTSALKGFSRQHSLGLTVRLSADELTLEAGISGHKTRGYFERFLAHHPTSYHRCDTIRLDHFIGAASRHRQGRVDIDRIQRYLLEILGWSDRDAQWCADRIRIGLEVLESQRKR